MITAIETAIRWTFTLKCGHRKFSTFQIKYPNHGNQNSPFLASITFIISKNNADSLRNLANLKESGCKYIYHDLLVNGVLQRPKTFSGENFFAIYYDILFK